MSFSVSTPVGGDVRLMARITGEVSNSLEQSTFYYRRTGYAISMAQFNGVPIAKDSQYLQPGDQIIFTGDLYLDPNGSPIGTVSNSFIVSKIVTVGSAVVPTVSEGFVQRLYRITNGPNGFVGDIFLTAYIQYTTLFNNGVLTSNAVAPSTSAIVGGNGNYAGLFGTATNANYTQQGVTIIGMNGQFLL